jgi:hypothetical protein
MKTTRKAVLAATVIGSMLGGGAIGAWLAVPSTSGAATTDTTAATSGGTGEAGGSSSGTFHSNEDPTHEKSESAQREGDENSGKAHFGHDGFHSNEDPTHEKSESAQREADEKAGSTPSAP